MIISQPMNSKKQNPKNDNISLICLEERSALESVALRGALEYLGYVVSIHWIGSKESFLKLLSEEATIDKTVVISGHGYKKGFLLSGEKVIKPEEFKGKIKWQGKNVISLGCRTGTKKFTNAFISSGVKAYLAPDNYPDGNAVLTFTIYLFFLLKKGNSMSAALKKVRQIDKELYSFKLYENTPSS